MDVSTSQYNLNITNAFIMTNVHRLARVFPPIPYINMCIRNILLFFGQDFLVAKNMLDE